nr:MAG TPA: hypothetical protein [Caudoviricetes sp.]
MIFIVNTIEQLPLTCIELYVLCFELTSPQCEYTKFLYKLYRF